MKHNLIGGDWVIGTGTSENRNPANPDDLIGLYAQASQADVELAITTASQAFDSWANTSPQIRSDLLDAVGTTILNRKEELGTLLAREEGKALAEAIGETVRAGQLFKFFAGEALRFSGDLVASVRPNVDVEVSREAVGVVGLITPWNFPIAIPAWKIAPALAYGNTVVFKPADLTPGCAHALAEILHECGCPPGVFNMVMGSGSMIGPILANSPHVAAISFTGSEPVGAGLAETCGRNRKKLQLEMGGKNPMVVMDDADLNIAVEACLNGAFYSTGQRCTASSRLIVQAGIHDQFVDALSKRMSDLSIGDPLSANTQMGPVASAKQLQTNLEYVQLAHNEGAHVIGGQELDRKGYFQAPALFVGATNNMRSSREEIFGPCASVIKITDLEEAITTANDTVFGLSSGICTQSLSAARNFKRRSAAGMVMVNLPTAGVDFHVPFGGRKGSSYGPREQGRYAVEFYSSVKTAYTFAG